MLSFSACLVCMCVLFIYTITQVSFVVSREKLSLIESKLLNSQPKFTDFFFFAYWYSNKETLKDYFRNALCNVIIFEVLLFQL